MSLALVNEIWKLLKVSIEAGDTSGAAEILVNYLVEEDYSPAEIKQVFRNDTNIKKALDYYLETPEDGLVEVKHDPYEDEDEDDLYFDDEDFDDTY